MNTNIPLFQFPPSLESEVAARARAQTHPQMHPHPHYDPSGTLLVARPSPPGPSQPRQTRYFTPAMQAQRVIAHLPGPVHPHRAPAVFFPPNEPALPYRAHDGGPAHANASSSPSAPYALASPHGPRFSREMMPLPADEHGRHQHVRLADNSMHDPPPPPSYPAPSPLADTPQYAAPVKHEDVNEDEMLWSEESEQQLYAFPTGPDMSMAAYECKPELGWDNTQLYTMQPGLFVDTSAMAPQSYVQPYVTDSPMSMDCPQLPAPTFAVRYPVPSSNTRSYTLEGAITPITPPPHAAFPATPAKSIVAPRTPSPPPMAALLPPTPQASTSRVKSEPYTAVVPPPAPVASPALTTAPVQKRPRGRPRKNPPSARPPSPPAVVDYPFPHFPDSPSSAGGSCSAPRPEDATVPGMRPAPTLTVGTPGTVGPMSAPKAHHHGLPGLGLGGEAVAGGLPAGQAIFRLNVPKDGDGDGADGREAEKKKPVMACFFCRERKIACGPPPPGAPRRCNQCTRRDLVCEYPKESRRGQHKRGTRAARVEALASASAAAAAAVAPPTSIQPKGKGRAVDLSGGSGAAPASASASPDLMPDLAGTLDFDFALPDAGSSSAHAHAPASPLTPLSPHGALLAAVAAERPSRSDKVARAQDREHRGKERSGSRAPAREGWEARRAVQQQQKRRAVGGGHGGGVAAAGAGAGAGRDSELAMAMVMGR